MDAKGGSTWQVAAGDKNRDYADVCLKWGVILNGPGSAGPWPDCAKALVDRGVSAKKLSDIRRFCEELHDGDIVVLRSGTNVVSGVGVVAGGYEHRLEFGDVDGWELEHVRRVRWVWNGLQAPQSFDTYAMKFGDTVQRLDSPQVLDWLDGLPVPDAAFSAVLPALPDSVVASEQSNLAEISEYLFDSGVASNAISSLEAEIGELIRIARWYLRSGHSPSESETVAYLAVPLLRALGWTPQTMALEWDRVDVALFSTLPRQDSHLAVVVEAKSKDWACLSAKSQAQTYAEQTGREECHRLVVTDGLRYGVFVRQAGEFPASPQAYLNLTRMRKSYPVFNCLGAREALFLMSPYWHEA
jgi:hypothetical protein